MKLRCYIAASIMAVSTAAVDVDMPETPEMPEIVVDHKEENKCSNVTNEGFMNA